MLTFWQGLLRVAQLHYFELKAVAFGPHIGRHLALGIAAQQMELASAIAVERRVVGGSLYGPDAPEPIRPCAQAVAVVVEQGVFGGQTPGGGIELSGAM